MQTEVVVRTMEADDAIQVYAALHLDIVEPQKLTVTILIVNGSMGPVILIQHRRVPQLWAILGLHSEI